MKCVTGIGGIFFKSKDPKKLQEWYRKHLGIEAGEDGSGVTFHTGPTVWAIFPENTRYFEAIVNAIHDQLSREQFESITGGLATGRRARSTIR